MGKTLYNNLTTEHTDISLFRLTQNNTVKNRVTSSYTP